MTQSADLLGAVARLPLDAPVGRLTQDTVRLDIKDPAVEPDYLYWVLRTPQYRQYCRAHLTGTTNLGLPREDFFAFEFPAPSAQLLTITEALGALDDKIESNERVARLVVDTAEALYLQAIAAGSTTISLQDAGKWLSGGTPSTSNSSYWGGDLPWISAASLKTFYLDSSERCLTTEGAAAATNVVPAGSVLFVVRGMSLKTEFRFGVAQRSVAFGQDCKAILPRIPSSVLAMALRTSRDAILDLVDEAGHGTGRLATDLLEQVEVAVPLDDSVPRKLDALLQRGAAAHAECAYLSELRDTLLPALFSGHIRVPEGVG